MLDAWQGTAERPSFRTVIVTPSDVHQPISRLYKALWDERALPDVRFTVVQDADEAAALLKIDEAELTRLMGQAETL